MLNRTKGTYGKDQQGNQVGRMSNVSRMKEMGEDLSLEEYKELCQQTMEDLMEEQTKSFLDMFRDQSPGFHLKPFFTCSGATLEKMCTQLIQTRLAECGWKDQVELECKKILTQDRNGKKKLEEVVAEVTPFARSHLPPRIMEEIATILKNEVSSVINDVTTSSEFCSDTFIH